MSRRLDQSTPCPRRRLRSRPHLPLLSITIITSLILSFFFSPLQPCHAYIPAVAVNDTSQLNLTDSSGLNMRYFAPAGVYDAGVSYQLEADVKTGGVDKGALVHFTENGAGNNVTTATPWIAMISCDLNETNASDTWDIFTLARDRGAIAALLYTLTGESCLINAEYVDDFEKPIDVFSTKSRSTALLIESQFNNTNATYYGYDLATLNRSTNIVDSLVNSTTAMASSKTYLIATLTARNSTGQAQQQPLPAPTTGSNNNTSSSGGSKGRSTAMIVLYVITGSVCSLFLCVVLLGAVRAIRHPERYGPRAGGRNGYVDGDANAGEDAGQTRAQGLGQAILDTFPIVKFNRARPVQNRKMQQRQSVGSAGGGGPFADSAAVAYDRAATGDEDGEKVQMEDVHQPSSSIDYDSSSYRSLGARDSYHSALNTAVGSTSDLHHQDPEIAAAARAIARQPTATTTTTRPPSNPAPNPSSSSESCPICLLDFEDGDDVRVLPCQLSHAYHVSCIDPWLLEVSPSCPLCRKDFSATSNAATTENNSNTATLLRASPSRNVPNGSGEPNASLPPASSSSRFGRYLAFVRRERRRSQIHAETSRALAEASAGASATAAGAAGRPSGSRARRTSGGGGGHVRLGSSSATAMIPEVDGEMSTTTGQPNFGSMSTSTSTSISNSLSAATGRRAGSRSGPFDLFRHVEPSSSQHAAATPSGHLAGDASSPTPPTATSTSALVPAPPPTGSIPILDESGNSTPPSSSSSGRRQQQRRLRRKDRAEQMGPGPF